MKRLHLCTIYQNRPEACINYPWNRGNDMFEDCQFYDSETKDLRTLEEQQKIKTQQEIEDYCVLCGKCCFYWEDGKPIHACSALKRIDINCESDNCLCHRKLMSS